MKKESALTVCETHKVVILYILADTFQGDFDWYIDLVQHLRSTDPRQLEYLWRFESTSWMFPSVSLHGRAIHTLRIKSLLSSLARYTLPRQIRTKSLRSSL